MAAAWVAAGDAPAPPAPPQRSGRAFILVLGVLYLWHCEQISFLFFMFAKKIAFEKKYFYVLHFSVLFLFENRKIILIMVTKIWSNLLVLFWTRRQIMMPTIFYFRGSGMFPYIYFWKHVFTPRLTPYVCLWWYLKSLVLTWLPLCWTACTSKSYCEYGYK